MRLNSLLIIPFLERHGTTVQSNQFESQGQTTAQLNRHKFPGNQQPRTAEPATNSRPFDLSLLGQKPHPTTQFHLGNDVGHNERPLGHRLWEFFHPKNDCHRTNPDPSTVAIDLALLRRPSSSRSTPSLHSGLSSAPTSPRSAVIGPPPIPVEYFSFALEKGETAESTYPSTKSLDPTILSSSSSLSASSSVLPVDHASASTPGPAESSSSTRCVVVQRRRTRVNRRAKVCKKPSGNKPNGSRTTVGDLPADQQMIILIALRWSIVLNLLVGRINVPRRVLW